MRKISKEDELLALRVEISTPCPEIGYKKPRAARCLEGSPDQQRQDQVWQAHTLRAEEGPQI